MGEDMGKEMENLDYVILGDAPEIVLKGEALPNPEKFVEKSLLELGRAMARNTIGEVPAMTPGDFKSDQTIAKALADVEIDDPYFKDLDPITDEGITDIAAIAIGKVEAAKEITTNPKLEGKLADFEEKIPQAIHKILNTRMTRRQFIKGGTDLILALTLTACGIRPTNLPTITPESTSSGEPPVTEVAPPPTTAPTTEPTKEPTPEVFKSLEGATATPSANGKSWNIKLENGNSFEVADPERDIKIDEFDVWKIFGKDGLLIYVFDPGIKHYDGTYTEGKGWINAKDLSPMDSQTFPMAYNEIVSDPNSSTETEQNNYQEFLDAVTFKFANEQGIQAIVDQLKSSDKIDQQLLSLWIRIYMQNNPGALKNPELVKGKSIILGATEARTAKLLEDTGAFKEWTDTVKDNNGRYAGIRYGWDFVYPISNDPNYLKPSVFGIETATKNEEGESISGILLGVASVDNNSNSVILVIAMRNSNGKFIVALRSANLDPNFSIPQGTVCRDSYQRPYVIPRDLPAGQFTNGVFGKSVTKESLMAALGDPIESIPSAKLNDWAVGSGEPNLGGGMKCYYPYGLTMSAHISITDLNYLPSTPWNFIPPVK